MPLTSKGAPFRSPLMLLTEAIPAAGLSRQTHRLIILAVCTIAPAAFGLLALALGQDANWDLRNYHYYNAYAFLSGRWDWDIGAAQIATFYNPLLDVPFYLAVEALPPRWVGFLLGTVHGLNFILLFYLAQRLIALPHPRWKPAVSFAIALVGMLGAGNLSELGTVFHDNVVSLLVLGALSILVAQHKRLGASSLKIALPVVAGAGLLAGLAAGLKQPSVVYAVGLCIACLAVPGMFQRRFVLAFVFGLGVLAGIAVAGGFWMAEMWERYANPLFPYFNHLFQSPFAEISDYRDYKFRPGSLVEFIFFPVIFSLYSHAVAEIPFRELRFLILFALLAVAATSWFARRLSIAFGATGVKAQADEPSAITERAGAGIVLTATVVAYAVWLHMFDIYRYLIPLELLAPLCIVLVLDRIPLRPGGKWFGALASVILILVMLQPGNWGRVAWGEEYVGTRVPPLADPAHTMVLMTGSAPTSFVIPAFPPQVRFLRIQSYFTTPLPPYRGFTPLMRRLVAEHRGPLYVLTETSVEQDGWTQAAMDAYELDLHKEQCQRVISRIEVEDQPLVLCPVSRRQDALAGTGG